MAAVLPVASTAAAPAGLPTALAALWPMALPLLVHDAGRVQWHPNAALRHLLGGRLGAADFDRWALEGRDAPEVAETVGIVDDAGRERELRPVAVPLAASGWRAWLVQDVTAERQARAAAERAVDELEAWSSLMPLGMMVLDGAGRILRTNRALEALLGPVPPHAGQLPPALAALLARDPASTAANAGLAETTVRVDMADGPRELRVRIADVGDDQGRPRRLILVMDRSAEAAGDLARVEMAALMDAAGVGVATYDRQRGWLSAPAAASGGQGAGSVMQGIARDIVEPGSLPEYERLQAALRGGERTEVRYAVRHPRLGLRWLLTRVEPAPQAGSGDAASVVTVDVTDQERAHRRSEQLLRELSTIMDVSTAGIAYLRGGIVARCNRRFERMVGAAAGAAAGASWRELLAAAGATPQDLADATHAMSDGGGYDGEVVRTDAGGRRTWISVSLRAAPSDPGDDESVAVLTDITGLKQQQSELQALVRERELMSSLSEVGIAVVRGSQMLRANPAMATLTGYSVPELTALDTSELYASARECVAFEEALAAGLRRDGRFSGERLLRRRDGRLRWVQVAARPVEAEGVDEGSVCSFVDVDERHRAREALLRQAGRTRAILDSVLVGIVSVTDGRIEWMNRSARRMFGGELADFVGEAISTVATPEADHPLRRLDYVQRLGDGQHEVFECRLRARDGREFWVVGSAVVTSSDAAAPQLTFALLDIDARRQAEVGVTRARESLQRVIDTAPLAIAVLDGADFSTLHGNAIATRLLGAAPAGLRPMLAAAVRPDAGEQRAELEAVGAAAGAARRWDTRVLALPAVAGTLPQLLLVASDVTEQRAADQARLAEAIAQREALVREVHHRIKNNLQGVAGLLQNHALRHPAVATEIGEAVRQVQAIAQVHGLQVGGGGTLRLAPLVEAVALAAGRTFGRTVGISRGPGADAFVLPEAESIPIALTVNELLTNAVKHGTGDPVEVVVRAAAGEGGAVIELRQPGRLPEGFDLKGVPSGVSGLGLVRALLPRRGATLVIEQDGGTVRSRVTLEPPVVRTDDPSATMPAVTSAAPTAPETRP